MNEQITSKYELTARRSIPQGVIVGGFSGRNDPWIITSSNFAELRSKLSKIHAAIEGMFDDIETMEGEMPHSLDLTIRASLGVNAQHFTVTATGTKDGTIGTTRPPGREV